MDITLREQLEASRYLTGFGMQENPADGAEARWTKKPVQESCKLPLAAAFGELYLEGPGTLELCRDRTVSGEGSAKITIPTTLAIREPHGRAYALSQLYRPLDHKDITHFNRISVWLYIEAPGFHAVYTEMSVHNSGEHIMPKPGRFEGTHFICLEPGIWHQVTWEIPYVYRDKVRALSMGVSLMGNLPEAADTISVYYDDLRLELVEEENYFGFDLKKNAIAYCHSGYKCGTRKEALVQNQGLKDFSLCDAGGKPVFQAAVTPAADGFSILDFSAFDTPGRYTLRLGDVKSKPFYIGEEAYHAAAWKTLNFFYTERCGFDVPGVHSACHLDVSNQHPDGRKIGTAGAWHDAGDLSQSLFKNIECAYAIADLSDAAKGKDDALALRAKEELRWGLNWIMRTRFGDGYRATGCTIGIWTDNILGTKDDLIREATRNGIENFLAAAICARAARMFTEDPVFNDWCLRCAREDFEFARARAGMPDEGGYSRLVFSSIAGLAGIELYQTTGEQRYLDFSALWARRVLACQQQEPRKDFSVPLAGFFYESPEKERIQSYYHRSHEHVPMQLLCALYQTVPDHEDAEMWKTGLSLYGQYIRDTADMIAPYSLLPSSIYELDNTDYSRFSHEGDRTKGAPSLEEYNAQVKKGIPLNERYYLRRFPVAYQFRGFHATLMSKAKATQYVHKALGDRDLKNIAIRQAEWVLGFNPYAASSCYGEGYDYAPLYVAFSNQLVGAVPVGFETFENEDVPFYPMQIAPTYKEVWGQTTCRLMWLIADML
jgi:hypothetical protein